MSRESTPAERVLQAKLAAHKKWAITDPVEGTKAARAAFNDRFANQADQDVKAAGQPPLSDAERSRRAEHLRAAYFAGLALKSAQARRKKAAPPGTRPAASPRRSHERREANISQPCSDKAGASPPGAHPAESARRNHVSEGPTLVAAAPGAAA